MGSSVEDVAELMQNIQLRLPVKDAARTSVLSKAWLHAWSTIPTLRFHVDEEGHMMVEVEVERTLSKSKFNKIDFKSQKWTTKLGRREYLSDNIPIESFELDVCIDNKESASVTKNWIRSVATKASSTLKELSLSVELTDATLMLPDEIFSVAENLTKLTVSARHTDCLKTPVNSIINCVSLREVVFSGVFISQELLDAIFSSCTLLEKIDLSLNDRYRYGDWYGYGDWDGDGDGDRDMDWYGDWKALKTMIKIKNLACLHEIRIYTKDGDSTDLEISGVPNLQLFRCHLSCRRQFSAYSISLGSSVTELWLGGTLIEDESSLEMIESGFPFLESLTLDIKYWPLSTFHFTCGSLKKLSLMWPPQHMVMEVQVYAPKLLNFFFEGYKLPLNLSFPVSTLVQTTFKFKLVLEAGDCVKASFFLIMREALTLSTKCDLCVSLPSGSERMLSSLIDLDDLRRMLPDPPANNVQRLEFQSEYDDECNLLFLNALFEICHPKHVYTKLQWVSASGPTNHFFKLMVMVMEGLEKNNRKRKKKASRRIPCWARYLKNVEIRNDEKWETLKDSHRTSLDRWANHYKLNWG